MISFSKTLENIRELRGITKTEMARMLDLSLPAYSLYEKGEREPKLSNLKRIASILNVSVDELLQDTTDNAFEEAQRLWKKLGYKIELNENNDVIITPPKNEESAIGMILPKIKFLFITTIITKGSYLESATDKLTNLLILVFEGYICGFEYATKNEN